MYSTVTQIADDDNVLKNELNETKPIEPDTKSITSKFTYNDYPPIKPTNPLYQSMTVIRPVTSLKVVAKPPKFNPIAPKQITDRRLLGIVAVLFFFPTGLIALGLAIKAQTKFRDGFIHESKKFNTRSFIVSCITIFLGFGWILGLFFGTDPWPRTNG